ncbi:hypothetical protein GH890_29815, partial [Bacillus thuringiensis]|nr:hypothetical protein [Bacillus thuringiensis]
PKSSTNGNTACFVATLNESEADPETVRANMKENSVKNSDSSFFRVTEEAVTRPGFLGKKITSMCGGASIYWLTPTCSSNGTDVETPGSEDDVESRQKRRTLRCVMCGCYKVYAPGVACVRRYNKKTRTVHYTVYFRGRPLYVFRVTKVCNLFRQC